MRRPAARASAAEATVTSAFVRAFVITYSCPSFSVFRPIFFVPFVGEATKKNKHLHNSQSLKKKTLPSLPKETVRPCKALAFFCSVSSAKAWRSWGGFHPWKSGWMGKSPLGDTDGKPHNLEKIVYCTPQIIIKKKCKQQTNLSM